ncbi:MAG: DUF4836 family protein [Algicola sp.]|nr:DUF4836 family protein [Algicola sp.]
MKKFLILSAFFGLVLFSSCKKDTPMAAGDGITIIPETTGMLMTFDMGSLMEKADFEYVKTLDFYKDMLKEVSSDNQKLVSILEDPSKSGIDTEQNMYVSLKFDPEGSEQVFGGVVFSLADRSAFEAMLAETDAQLDIQNGDGYQYAIGDSKTIVGWSDQFVVVGFSNTYMELAQEMEAYFKTTPETSIANQSDIKSNLETGHDISMWLTTNPFADNPSAQFALSMAEIDPEALRDNYIRSYVDFENGKITGTSDLDLQKALTKDLGKFFDDKVDTDYTAYVPQDDLLFAITVAIDMTGIDEVLTARPQSKQFLDYSLQQYGLSFTDIANTFGGDILIAGTKGEVQGTTAGIVAININDDDKLMDFINMAIENRALEADGDNVYKLTPFLTRSSMKEMDMDVNFPDGSARLIIENDIIFVTGDPTTMAMIQDGGYSRGDRASGEIKSLLSDHVYGTYFAMKAMREFDPEMENMPFSIMEGFMDSETGEFTFEMEDDSQNALRLLMETANEEYLKEKQEAMSDGEAM